MKRTIFFTSYAKLPSNTTANNLYDVLACVVEVEKETGVIVDADCTLATELSRDFVKRLLKGYNLLNDFPEVINEIEERYCGNADKALITAVKKISAQYQSYISN
ncbi:MULTISPECIES: DUF3870 domain-containing protein [unclassified Candidatus Frackibacter]|uniref:DUF3870 domain-containing protein n=1 Tax=unclassified Candidatus Frackibacter TaxID=2648818 RepID=UPI00079AD03E|nr:MULTISPECIES: DUF3870 domain-containing protein [unclassified Candidatus Frackibacter]KXS43447.1 MAG: hypothetical protein AWU54_1028 [Candidatus Frackibacter sp. T328-2]SDC57344.1 protein of unknown function [Candidatus Frackibacter sp. WG11]SEM71443.1 protein of unknown function [Candidatus Frackibacter sp. WG12]SFL82809.1 protein of unknown function [Candidatus Frackibacter sp. WG13]